MVEESLKEFQKDTESDVNAYLVDVEKENTNLESFAHESVSNDLCFCWHGYAS